MYDNAVKESYNPIQDIVRAKSNFRFQEEQTVRRGTGYLQIVMDFMRAGCEIDQPDEKGFTALHDSVILGNGNAVPALIHLGADVNACKVDSSILRQPEVNFNTLKYLAFQVQKMLILGLDVTFDSKSIHAWIYAQFSKTALMEDNLEMLVAMELEKAEKYKLTKVFTARSFLSELCAVVHYSRLHPNDRKSIDVFFKDVDYVVEQFPVLCGLMLSQYKKAVVRPRLMAIGKEVLASECNVYLPDLCWDWLSSYMSNNALKYLIEHSGKAVLLLSIFKTD